MQHIKGSLVREIIIDIVRSNKLVVILFLLITISAVAKIYRSYETRGLITKIEKLSEEKRVLEIQNSNLKLEKATLSDTKKIESIAKEKLHMEPTRIIYDFD